MVKNAKEGPKTIYIKVPHQHERRSDRRRAAANAFTWLKKVDKHCYGATLNNAQSFTSLNDAEVACGATPYCFGVYDNNCDAQGPYKLCQASDRWKTSGAGSCIYEKMTSNGTVTPVAPTNNGITWVKETRKHCYPTRDTSQPFNTVEAAEAACAGDAACYGVYDNNCDNAGTVYMCNGEASTWPTSHRSCIYKKTVDPLCQLTLKLKQNYHETDAPTSFDEAGIIADSQTYVCNIQFNETAGQHTWGGISVDDNFAAEITAWIDIRSAGLYTFYTNSDDGSMIYVDGNRVVHKEGMMHNSQP